MEQTRSNATTNSGLQASAASIGCFAGAGALLLITIVLWAIMCRLYNRRVTAVTKSTEITVPRTKDDPLPELNTFGESGAYIEFGKSIDNSLATRAIYESMGQSMTSHNLPRDMDAARETFDGSRMPTGVAPTIPTSTTRVDSEKPEIKSPPPRVTLKMREMNNVGQSNDVITSGSALASSSVNERKSKHEYDDVEEKDLRGLTETYEVPVNSTLTRDRPPTVPARRIN